MLVPIPIGLWLFSLACDLIGRFGGGGGAWTTVAFYTMVGGIVGALLIGFLATTAVNDAGADGLLAGGGFALLGKQAVAVLATLAYSFTVTFLIAKVIDLTMGFRISADDEAAGIDSTAHAETAYDFGTIRAGIGSGSGATAAAPAAPAKKVEA
jgi:Amt family ammonium transporter